MMQPTSTKKHIGFSFYTLLLFLAFFSFLAGISRAEMVSIKGEKVHLREGPGTNYAILWEFDQGFPLKVIQKKGSWIKVQDFEKDSGWIHESLIHNSPHVVVKANRHNNKQINIRKKPSLSSEIIAQAKYGVVFKTLKRQSGWCYVEHESGLKGWIKNSLLWGY